MEFLVTLLLIITLLLCLGYVALIASYCHAWVKMKPPVFSAELLTTKVSVIIAARNEENSIANCVNAVLQQTYPSQYIEIIIVDDASEDTTGNKIQELCKKHENIKSITLEAGNAAVGKKQALTLGIQQSNAELIVTTDADCVMNKNWLKTIVAFYQQTKAKMIVAPVVFHNEKSVFEKMQTLEFMSLIVSGGASLYYNKAIMCNGANLAYTRNVFYEVNGFKGADNKPSGDDVLLMYKIKKKYPDSIKFLKHEDAIVFTDAQPNLKGFIDQRKRWASKGFKALNTETKKVSLLVYGFNFSLFAVMILSFCCKAVGIYGIGPVPLFCVLFGIKCLIDFLLLFLASSFFKKRK